MSCAPAHWVSATSHPSLMVTMLRKPTPGWRVTRASPISACTAAINSTSLLGGYVAGCVAAHGAVFDGHQVAAQGRLPRFQFDPQGHGFDGTPAAVVACGIVAQNAHAGDGARRLHAFRHGVEQSNSARGGDAVEMGNAGGLERGASAQCLRGPPSRPVDDQYHRFHAPSARICASTRRLTMHDERLPPCMTMPSISGYHAHRS